jgi:hypothetical protein
MGKLEETKREKAHRCFKWYKAHDSKEFPKDIPLLEAFKLMSEYYPFMAKEISKKTINALTSICNKLETEKIVLVYGDVVANILRVGLHKYFVHEKEKLTIKIIDCVLTPNLRNYFKTSLTIRSHFDEYIIYIVNNIQKIDSTNVSFLIDSKNELFGHDKAIICCAPILNNVNVFLRATLKSIKIGREYTKNTQFTKIVKCLIKFTDREKSFNYLVNCGVNIHYIFKLVSYNMRIFFTGKQYEENIALMNRLSKYIYKSHESMIFFSLVHGLHKSKKKRTIIYPPKLLKKE